jgi:hypothetical protein
MCAAPQQYDRPETAAKAPKLDRPAPARELYVPQLFRKASAYADATCDRWYILSAKHGLIHPDTVIDPCDTKLGTPSAPPLRQWAAGVRDQLAAELADLDDVTLIALAGAQYRTALLDSPWPSEVPMEGLGIGRQLGWLTAKLSGEPVGVQTKHDA